MIGYTNLSNNQFVILTLKKFQNHVNFFLNMYIIIIKHIKP